MFCAWSSAQSIRRRTGIYRWEPWIQAGAEVAHKTIKETKKIVKEKVKQKETKEENNDIVEERTEDAVSEDTLEKETVELSNLQNRINER